MKANGANMPRCLQRGALFDYRKIKLFFAYIEKFNRSQR